MSDKVKSIEGIRGVASLAVVISHLTLAFFPFLHNYARNDSSNNPIQEFFYNSPFGFFYSGTSAVFIFFVLSGYILTYVILKNENQLRQVFSMSLKRYFRLMIPAATSTILAYLAFEFITVDRSSFTGWVADYGNFSYSFLGALYNGAIEVFFLSGKSSYNHVLWTMKIELFGSFFIFFLCILKIKISSNSNLVRFIVFLFSIIIIQLISSSIIFGLGLLSFLIGYALYVYGKVISLKLSIVLLVIGLYLAGAHNDSASYWIITKIIGDRIYLACNFLSGIIIVYAIIFNHTLNTVFSSQICVFMGKVSFSVYLIHMPVIATLGVFYFNLLNKGFLSYELAAMISSLLVIITTYLFAIIYFKCIDHPGMKISNKFSKSILKSVNK